MAVGIDNLKKVVKFACDFTAQIATALADGKFQWSDSLGFINELAQIPDVAKAFPALKAEIAGLDDTERADLFAYIVSEFSIPNHAVEVLIENSISFALSAVTLFEQWKALKAAPKV